MEFPSRLNKAHLLQCPFKFQLKFPKQQKEGKCLSLTTSWVDKQEVHKCTLHIKVSPLGASATLLCNRIEHNKVKFAQRSRESRLQESCVKKKKKDRYGIIRYIWTQMAPNSDLINRTKKDSLFFEGKLFLRISLFLCNFDLFTNMGRHNQWKAV